MEENTLHNDRVLFALIAAGNEEAFRSVFHQYTRKLYPFIYSMVKSESDAKEIIQEVFMKLWLKRESLTAIEIPGAWLHTLTSHAAYDFLRTQARYSLRLQKLPKVEDGADIVIDQLDARFTQAVINEAVEQLPFKRREVFRMARIEGKSRREIATELNISENTVRNQLVSAVESVREYLTQKGALYMPVLIFLLKDL